ncbi:unnamed protein product [Prunus armeniaca]
MSHRDIWTVGARIANQVDWMSPEFSEDYRAGRVTTVARGIDSNLGCPTGLKNIRIVGARDADSLNPARKAARVDLVSSRPARACYQW